MFRQRIEFELTREDLLRAAPEVVAREPFLQQLKHKSRRTAIVVVGMGLLLATVISSLEEILGFGPVPSILVGFFFLCLGSAVWSTDTKLRNLARSNLAVALTVDPAYQAGLGPRAYTLDADRFQLEMAHGQSVLFWSCIVRTVRLPDDFILVAPGPGNHIFPRDIFPTDHDFEEFITEIERRIVDAGGQIGDSHETTD